MGQKRVICMLLTVVCFAVFGGAHAEDVPNDFSDRAQEYLEYIGTYLKNRNCPADGALDDEENRHDEARDWIIDTIRRVGYAEEQIARSSAQVSTWDECTYTLTNIVLTVQGENPDKQIILGAHYDGDGVGDNGSGVALLLATIEGLFGRTLPVTVKYVFFDGEEDGMLGANLYADGMTNAEIKRTLFMINIDALAFGDYCLIYGGDQNERTDAVTRTSAYELAVLRARELGIKVYTSEDLDGYYARNGEGPEILPGTLFTNPWTNNNPAPINHDSVSPTTGDWSDHVGFKYLGIPYLYMEATNWFAFGDGGTEAYTGYFETIDDELGMSGMFMNTEYDTLAYMNEHYPGRSLSHFRIFSPLLSAIILAPEI